MFFLIHLYLLCNLQLGFEGSFSSSKIFIYNTDTLMSENSVLLFLQYSKNTNFIRLATNKSSHSVMFNFESGRYRANGSFFSDTTPVSNKNLYVSVSLLRGYIEPFFSVENVYDTVVQEGKYAGINFHSDFPEKLLFFYVVCKRNLESGQWYFSDNLFFQSSNFSALGTTSYENGENNYSMALSHKYSGKHMGLYSELDYFSENMELDEMLGTEGLKAGGFLELNSQEQSRALGSITQIVTFKRHFDVNFKLKAGYKSYKDQFFYTNGFLVNLIGNASLAFYGNSLTTQLIYEHERDNTNFYIDIEIARKL